MKLLIGQLQFIRPAAAYLKACHWLIGTLLLALMTFGSYSNLKTLKKVNFCYLDGQKFAESHNLVEIFKQAIHINQLKAMQLNEFGGAEHL